MLLTVSEVRNGNDTSSDDQMIIDMANIRCVLG